MLQLIYLSRATAPLSDDDLIEILDASRLNNLSMGVTGVLLFARSTFLQVLEGPPSVVTDLYEHIEQDLRHDNSWILRESSITARDFPDWTMGFQPVEEDSELSNAFFELTEQTDFTIGNTAQSDRVMKRLRQFSELALKAS